jgi:hypothetical protein
MHKLGTGAGSPAKRRKEHAKGQQPYRMLLATLVRKLICIAAPALPFEWMRRGFEPLRAPMNYNQ